MVVNVYMAKILDPGAKIKIASFNFPILGSHPRIIAYDIKVQTQVSWAGHILSFMDKTV